MAMVSTRESAGDDTRARIQRVALELMAVDGASGVSMRQLAKACDLNVATLYHHFPSKADLLTSVLTDRDYIALLGIGLPIDTTLPPRERMSALVQSVWAGAIGESDIWRLVIGESLRSSDVATEVVAELVRAMRDTMTSWLAEGFPELAVPAADAAAVITGQVFGYFIEVLVIPPDDVTRYLAQRAEQVAAVLFP